MNNDYQKKNETKNSVVEDEKLILLSKQNDIMVFICSINLSKTLQVNLLGNGIE